VTPKFLHGLILAIILPVASGICLGNGANIEQQYQKIVNLETAYADAIRFNNIDQAQTLKTDLENAMRDYQSALTKEQQQERQDQKKGAPPAPMDALGVGH
jgi:hypothetical protein